VSKHPGTSWRQAEREHAARVHAEAVAEHLRACEDRSEGSVDASALDCARSAALSALDVADSLGFETPSDALRCVLGCSDYRERWECSAEVVRAVEHYRALRLAARVAGVRP
jgi:hypothetical protein